MTTQPGLKRNSVLFYFVATHLGGAERSVLTLIDGLLADPGRRYTPLALVPKPDGPLCVELEKRGVPVHVIAIPPRFLKTSRRKPLLSAVQTWASTPALSAYVIKVRGWLKTSNPDLIYSVGIKCHLFSGLLSPFVGKPVLWHLRDLFLPGPTRTALRAVSRLPLVRLAANSAATAASFGGSDPDQAIPIIHNGLDQNAYRPQPNRAFNRDFDVSDKTCIVGIVGVIARWKGQLEFIKMAAQLVAAGTDARFVIVGAEIYDTMAEQGVLKLLQEEVTKLGLESHVRFTGYTDDPARSINGLDVLVHASIEPEPFGRVIVEAMACGVAVAAPAAGGVRELIDDGRTGILFRPGNIDAMASAVGRLIADRGLRAKLAAAGRERFIRHFTQESYVRDCLRTFDRIVSRKEDAPPPRA